MLKVRVLPPHCKISERGVVFLSLGRPTRQSWGAIMWRRGMTVRAVVARERARMDLGLEKLEQRTAMAAISSGPPLVVPDSSNAEGNAPVLIKGQNAVQPIESTWTSPALRPLDNEVACGGNRPAANQSTMNDSTPRCLQSVVAASSKPSAVEQIPAHLIKRPSSTSTNVVRRPAALWTRGRFRGWTSSGDSFDYGKPRVPNGVTFSISRDGRTLKNLSMRFYAMMHWRSGFYSALEPRLIRFHEAGTPELTLARTRAWQTFTFDYVGDSGHTWTTELKLRWDAAAKRFSAVINTDTDGVTDNGATTSYSATNVFGRNVRRVSIATP